MKVIPETQLALLLIHRISHEVGLLQQYFNFIGKKIEDLMFEHLLNAR